MNKAQPISDSEKVIMKLIWDNGGSIYISDLLKKVEQRNKEWKRTTVRTFITRLMDKGFIETIRHGRISEYRAVLSEEEYLSRQARSFVDEVFCGNIQNLMSSLFGQDCLKKKELEELKDFWEKGKEDLQ